MNDGETLFLFQNGCKNLRKFAETILKKKTNLFKKVFVTNKELQNYSKISKVDLICNKQKLFLIVNQ